MEIPQTNNVTNSLQAIAQVGAKTSVPPQHTASPRLATPPSGGEGVTYERAVELAAWTERLHSLPDTRQEVIADVKQRMSDAQQYLDRPAAERLAGRILGD
ncbi:MAG: hypothetical protein EA424_08275 [Planctomycetaceae bacterium]|jgi:hypothetical protein|nr:MAG: hypothetical protein EA424_08275 [Planctomycetaceae bacterium]